MDSAGPAASDICRNVDIFQVCTLVFPVRVTIRVSSVHLPEVFHSVTALDKDTGDAVEEIALPDANSNKLHAEEI